MSSRPHPFDRYSAFTDVEALKQVSATMLRKSVRVNLIKSSVEAFEKHAAEQGWALTPVPWTREGFFINRTDVSKALGRDVMHLLGHFYMQEASSMLPAALLQPKPGDVILDMSAAPGSKTTQIGSALLGKGIIISNDVQEKRLWTLKHAINRLGVWNTVVTKKVGQWFSRHMTERFDAVLCDAPCTAQGTARKDSDALTYSSLDNVEKMARLQRDLLEAAVHATKVGGRIVYSTCTLTPEENEGIIALILNKFPTQLEVVDPRTLGIAADGTWDKPIEDSMRVQEWMKAQGSHPNVEQPPLPLLRLWPQTFDSEGFFCAVLRKTAPTRHPEPMDRMPLQEKLLPKGRQRDFAKQLEEMFGTPMIREDEVLLERGAELVLTSAEVFEYPLPLQDYAIGIPFGRRDDMRVRIGQEIAALRGHEATKSVRELSDEELEIVLAGGDIPTAPGLIGDVILRWKGIALGTGVVSKQLIKNRLSRWMVQRS